MATGTLVNGQLTQNVQENVYNCPDSAYAVVKIKMLNIGSSDMNIRMALHQGTVTDADYIEYDTSIVPKGYIERSGVVLGEGQSISLWCTDSSNCVFTINGTEVGVPFVPRPTYNIIPAANSLNEDSTLNVSVVTTLVLGGTPLFWSIDDSPSAFVSSSGTFTISGSSGSFTISSTAEATPGTEFTINIRTGSTTGPIVATTDTLTVESSIPAFITIENPNPNTVSTTDLFGDAIDISESYVLVGAWREEDDGTLDANDDSGRAYIFNLSGTLLHTLDNPNDFGTGTGDYFGFKVAVTDDYAVVSARFEDPPAGTNFGAVYIFNPVTGNKLHTLTTPESAGSFGDALAVSGSYLVVGQPNAPDGGKVHVYNPATGSLRYTIDNPNAFGTESADQFGFSVDATSSYIIAGAPGEDDDDGTSSGKAYIFDITDGSLLLTLDNPNADGNTGTVNDGFGSMMRITESYVAAGASLEDIQGSNAGALYIFSTSTGNLLHTIQHPDSGVFFPDGDQFGRFVGITDSYVVAHSEDDILAARDRIGAVYVYDLSTGDRANTFNGPSGDIIYGTNVCAFGNRAAFQRIVSGVRKVEIIRIPS